MVMKETSIMSEEKKTSKLSEEIKRKHADKFANHHNTIVIDGKEMTIEEYRKMMNAKEKQHNQNK